MKHWPIARLLLLAGLGLATLARAAPLQPEAVESLPYHLLGEPAATQGELRIALSPGGALIATNDLTNVWLYQRDTGKRLALTPGVAPRGAAQANAIGSIEAMRWSQDATLYAWLRLQSGGQQVYAGDAHGPRGVVRQPPQHWPDDNAAWAASYAIPERDFADEIRANAGHIVWLQNRGHGDLALMTAAREGKPRVLARGNWELSGTVFDASASRVIHASDKGVVVRALDSGQAQAIAGTRAEDRPMSFDVASRWLLLYRPRGGCDAATAQATAPHACLLRLPAVASAAPAPPPAPQASVQPSFDCTKARSTTELLLCERAPLAALDVELAGLYRQALERSANPGALRKQQTDWLRERDWSCTAGKTLAQARELLAVDTCLREHYGARARLLRDQVAPDIGLTRLQGRNASAASSDGAPPPRTATLQASAAVRAMGDEGLIPNTALQLGEHLIWLSDQGRGDVLLRTKRRGQPGTLTLQRGSWELLHLLHDEGHLIYPSDDGLMFLELATGRAHRIRQTAMADLPRAWNPATRELAWTSPRLCGITRGGNKLGPQWCTAVLDMPRR